MKELNPLVWFGTRELKVIPSHFVKSTTPKTEESYLWVLTSLSGRFGVSTVTLETIFDTAQIFYFEDSAEAMLYELRWSGS